MGRIAVLLAVLCALAAPAGAQAAGLTATKRVLSRELARAGGSAGAYVVALDTGRALYATRADVRRMPASVEKLYTTATAMLLYGTGGHLTPTVLAGGVPDEPAVLNGNLVLRGGGDPTFGPAAADALAERLVNGGLTEITGRVVGDESAFDGFRGVPSSNYALTSDVGPLSALSYDHGRTGKRRPYWQASPAKFAATALAKALRERGVAIGGGARAGEA